MQHPEGNSLGCRLLITPAMEGTTNMALDEAMLILYGQGLVPPTLRFYSWRPPCLSIGYSQSARQEVDEEECRRLGIHLVRRPTGGRAILHDRELTYSLVVPEADQRFSGPIVESYRKLSRGLVLGLAHLALLAEVAPPARENSASRSGACFDTPSSYEITLGGRKVVGSAQCRRLGIILQQGSLLLDMDHERSLQVLRPPAGEDHTAWRDAFAQRATSLREALGRPVSFQEAAQALARGFGQALGLRLEPGLLIPQEWELAQRLRQEKYANPAWTMAR